MVYDPDDPSGFSIMSKDDSTVSRMLAYWDRRARGYNLLTRLQLHDTKHYEHIIEALVPLGHKASICDMGTSCGFMALLAAKMGHTVMGIDRLPKMIYYARKNAQELGLDVDFRVGNVSSLRVPKASFDLIIARSIIWCLEDPVRTLRYWMSLLKPGGHILIIDGNYYLDNFDKDYLAKHELDKLKRSEETGMHGKTNMDSVDFDEIREIATDLPACSMRRPGWDTSVLLGLRMDNIFVNLEDKVPYTVSTASGYMILPGTFVVTARKPFEKTEDPAFGADDDSSQALDYEKDTMKVSAARFKALADANRVEILQILLKGSRNVKDLSDILGCSVSLTSHNLKILSSAGLITSVKVGKEVFYGITDSKTLFEILYYMKRGFKPEPPGKD